jgi:hypothetical protein
VSWRSLLSFLLLWIAWAATITSLIALTALDWTLAGVALLFVLVGAALILGARALTEQWYQQFIIVTALSGVVSIIRLILDPEHGGDLLIAGVVSLMCSAGLAIGRRVRSGRRASLAGNTPAAEAGGHTEAD